MSRYVLARAQPPTRPSYREHLPWPLTGTIQALNVKSQTINANAVFRLNNNRDNKLLAPNGALRMRIFWATGEWTDFPASLIFFSAVLYFLCAWMSASLCDAVSSSSWHSINNSGSSPRAAGAELDITDCSETTKHFKSKNLWHKWKVKRTLMQW